MKHKGDVNNGNTFQPCCPHQIINDRYFLTTYISLFQHLLFCSVFTQVWTFSVLQFITFCFYLHGSQCSNCCRKYIVFQVSVSRSGVEVDVDYLDFQGQSSHEAVFSIPSFHFSYVFSRWVSLLVSCLSQDTAGSERYEAMSRIYYRGARAAIVCYGKLTLFSLGLQIF